MCKCLSYLFLLVLLLFTQSGKAQDTDYDTTVSVSTTDSVSSIEDLYDESDEEKEPAFDVVLLEDQSVVATRKVDEAKLKEIREDDAFWYANEAPKREVKKQVDNSESFLDKLARKKWFRNLLWIIIVGGFIAVLIWFLISSDIQLFKKSAIPIQYQEDALVNKSIFDIDYEVEIQKALTAQNLRLAVRLYYLQTLKRLSEEGVINYKQERTNNDYLLQLFNTNYYKDFFRLTRHFEYTWYGQFQVTTATFEIIKTDFFTFQQRFLS